MFIVGVAIFEELGEVATAPVTEEALLSLEIATDHIRDLHESTLLEFHRVYSLPICAILQGAGPVSQPTLRLVIPGTSSFSP
jgi:hypothetical protein